METQRKTMKVSTKYFTTFVIKYFLSKQFQIAPIIKALVFGSCVNWVIKAFFSNYVMFSNGIHGTAVIGPL